MQMPIKYGNYIQIPIYFKLVTETEVAMSSCNSGSSCSSCSSSNSCKTDEKEKHAQEMLEKKLSNIKYKIMVMSGKGGVGKSTTTVSLASSLNALGYKVGILDADVHGPNIPKMFGITKKGIESSVNGMVAPEPIPGIKIMSVGFLVKDDDDAIIWRAPIKHSLIQQFLSDVDWGELDFLLIDLPPGTGDEPLSVAHIIGKVDGSVVVTTPQEVALLDARKSVTFSRKLNIPVFGIIENMSGLICPDCGKKIDLFKTGGGKIAAQELETHFLGEAPIDPRVVEKGDEGKPFVLEYPESEFAKAYLDVAKQVAELTVEK